VGNDPHEVIASTDGKTAYVSNYGGGAFNTLAVIDLIAQKPLSQIDLGALRGPHGLDFAGGKVWFTAEEAKAVGSYDPATQKIDWIFGTGQNRTHMIHVSPDAQRIVTTNVSSATVSIIEKIAVRTSGPQPNQRQGTNGAPPPGPPPGSPRSDWNQTLVAVGSGDEGFDISPDNKEIWTANSQDGTISIINLTDKKVVQTLDANVRSANRLKFTPDGKQVFVSMLGSSEPASRRGHPQGSKTHPCRPRRRRNSHATRRLSRLRRLHSRQLRRGHRSQNAPNHRPHRRRPQSRRSSLGHSTLIPTYMSCEIYRGIPVAVSFLM
jgi:DNA-binding beta-propeller fold protein YncE